MPNFVRRIRANPQIPLAHEETLKTDLARYNMTRVELKTFTFSAGPQSLPINQAIMGRIPQRLLFTMIAKIFSAPSKGIVSDFNISIFAHS
jgi:hypothetical protein